MMSKSTKDACITRWIFLLPECKIKLYYLPGKENIFSDTLSRLVDIRNKCDDLPNQLEKKLLNKVSMLKDKRTNDINEAKIDDTLHSYILLKPLWTEDEVLLAQNNDRVY